MTIKDKIERALSCLKMPIAKDVYKGSRKTEYIVYNYADNRPSQYADDTDILWTASLQVHCYTQKDAEHRAKIMRTCLRREGFTITGTQHLYEQATDDTHIVVEIETEYETNDEEVI